MLFCSLLAFTLFLASRPSAAQIVLPQVVYLARACQIKDFASWFRGEDRRQSWSIRLTPFGQYWVAISIN
jgi:hypothetical protein